MSVSSSGWAPGSSVGSAGMLRWQQAACLSGPSGGPPERHKYNEKFAYKGEEGEGGGGGSWEWDLSYNHTKIFSTIKSFTKFDIKYPQCGMWNKKVKIHKIRKLKMQMKDPQWSYGSSNLMYQWGSSCRMDSSSITYNIQTGVLPITSKHRDMIATEICLLQTFYSHKINFKTCVFTYRFFFFAILRK